VNHHDKSLGAVLAETKEELKEFFATRLQIFRAEIKEKLQTLKYAIPLLLAAVALVFVGWVVLTFALVALIRVWFLPSPFAWLWASLIVSVLYLITAGIVGWLGYSEIRSVGVAPKRTMEVLKQDQVWIQNEARTV
jgi:uncharacterized membrane protein YqjE